VAHPFARVPLVWPAAHGGAGLEDVPEEQRAHVYAEQLKRLDQIEEMVNQISIPLSFADGLYGLRSHINFVRKRILTLMGASGARGGRAGLMT
jgi:predicted site-specific integrase-resolvase